MASLEDPEVQALLGQMHRSSGITAGVTAVVTFTCFLGGALVAAGYVMPTVPIAAVLAVGCGVVFARETAKSNRIRRQIQDLMFPKAK
jgi:hypothetical protein